MVRGRTVWGMENVFVLRLLHRGVPHYVTSSGYRRFGYTPDRRFAMRLHRDEAVFHLRAIRAQWPTRMRKGLTLVRLVPRKGGGQ